MAYYNHANFDIKKHLIRELVLGEKFKVLPKPELNINMNMLEFRCTWVTVSDVITSPFTDYLDDCYIKEHETTAYHIQEEVDLNDFSGDWHPYHMDIAETNYLILKNDRAINFIKAKPSMPSI